MTDWTAWHAPYQDPSSELSRRLALVQRCIRTWASDQAPGPLRVLSLCAGQGHDLVGALRDHPRRSDVHGLLVEKEESNVARARAALSESGLSSLHPVVGDAGSTTAFATGVPAGLVLVCGVFGNIDDADVSRTIEHLPTLCSAGATVIWTRHRREPDLTPAIRGWFAGAGFEERGFFSPGREQFSVGVHRLSGQPEAFRPAVRLFAFTR